MSKNKPDTSIDSDQSLEQEINKLYSKPKWLELIDKNRQLIYIIAPFLIWGSTLFHEEIKDSVKKYSEEPRLILRPIQETIWASKALFRRGEKNTYINNLKNEKVDNIDLGKFFSKRDYLKGRLSKEEAQKCFKGIQAHLKKYKEQAQTSSVRKNIHDMINNQGRYLATSDSICEVILKGTGNCVGRSEYMQTMIRGTYGKKIKTRWHKFSDHQQLIAKIDQKWYELQKPGAKPLSSKDLNKTITTEPDAAIKSYIGKKNNLF